MDVFLNLGFFASVALCYIVLPLASATKGHRTTLFGALNLVALSAILGLRASVAVLVLGLSLWCALKIHRSICATRKASRLILEVSLYLALTLAFLFHKTILDLGFSSSFIGANVLQTIAFSYVYLRSLDVVRVVASGGILVDVISLSGYLLPFFMTPAGPVNVYADHIKMNDTDTANPTWTRFIDAVDVITSGLFLKFVIAELWKLYFVGTSHVWPTDSLIESATIFIYVYFDFCGYSLVALGVGRLLGVPTPVNFRSPWRSISLTDFWTRWHVSLGDFVRRGLFFPMQIAMVRRFGRRWAYMTNLAALIVSFAFVGVWHRLSITFLVWGVIVGILVAAEKLLRDRWIKTAQSHPIAERLLSVVGPIYVFLAVVGTLHIAMPELLGQRR